tara:strand:+ start:211 stop:1038 length:828 start_codon:yes stop_codon:yes gene_type:complete
MNFILDRFAIKKQFSRIAENYDDVSFLQKKVADELLSRLKFFEPSENIVIDIGSATGYIGRDLRKKFPNASVLEIDLSFAMASESLKIDPASRVLVSSVEKLPFANETVPMIISNMLLHWCDLSKALSEIARVLEVGGNFFFTTLGQGSLSELRSIWSKIDDFPHVHDFYDMHDIGDALMVAGFSEPIIDTDRTYTTYTNFSQLIGELRHIGATNARVDRQKGLMGTSKYNSVASAYKKYRNQAGRLPVTWEIVYGLATKNRVWTSKDIPVAMGR